MALLQWAVRRGRTRTGAGLRWLPVHWFFTGLLIAVSAGTVAFTGHLLRRLFTAGPGAPETTDHSETDTPVERA